MNRKVEYDDALNTAGWVLLDEISKYQEVEPHLFNNLKSCLKKSIETYLNEKEDPCK